MRIKIIHAKIAAAIAPLALTAAIMVPTASAAVTPASSQGTLGTPIQLQFVSSALLFFPGILNPGDA